uniref:Uncharacterized protein n=1 Tax=Caenorhabditis japonica TaxID=281687 RepID=A0A8R1IQL7_CAEJA
MPLPGFNKTVPQSDIFTTPTYRSELKTDGNDHEIRPAAHGTSDECIAKSSAQCGARTRDNQIKSLCFTFCDQRPGNVTQLDLSYLACYDRFENMKACFYQKASEGSMSFNTDDVDEQEQQQERFAFAEPVPAFRAPAQPAQPADPLAAVQQLLAKTFGQ